jgi:diguanylate cyclase (GGDEF)-like protein
MSLENNVILNVYSAIILLVIYIHALRFFHKESAQDRLYLAILYINFLLLGLDILSRFDGYASGFYTAANAFGNFVVFLVSPTIPSLWVAYVHLQVFGEERKTKRLHQGLVILHIVNAAMVIASQFFGWLYSIDSQNVYHRGPLFFLPVLITVALLFAAFAIVYKNRGRLERKKFLSLIFFVVPPAAAIILQISFYGISLMLNGVTLSLLVVFLNLQSDNMYTDHLTGLNNRKKLDAYLEEKVHSGAEGKSFSAILLDINDFKYINDTYGHDTGDHALKTTARLLKSCLGMDDFVARYGGDEFCIVLDVSGKGELEAIMRKINEYFKIYNESGPRPYKLELSMGYAAYDRHSRLSAEEFLRKVDMMMYKSKQAHKMG